MRLSRAGKLAGANIGLFVIFVVCLAMVGFNLVTRVLLVICCLGGLLLRRMREDSRVGSEPWWRSNSQ